MSQNRNILHDDPSKSDKRQRFLPNNRYFTICIYAVTVILLGALIVRVVMTPFAVTNGIKRVLNVLMPFLMGILIAMIMNPIINWISQIMEQFLKLKKKKVRIILASVLAYMLVLGLILICIIFIVPQVFTSITELVNSLPKMYRLTTNFFNNLQQHFPNTDMSEIQKAVNDMLPNLISTIRKFASDIVPAIYSASVSIVQWILNAIVALIVSIYILGDKKSLKKLIKNAEFEQPDASIAAVDYGHNRKINRHLIERLATCEYITEHRNLFITGATGSGKTYMACAFGMEACKRRYTTKYVRLPDLLLELEMARNDGTYKKVQSKYANPILLIIDEWLLLKPTASEQHDILELLHRRRKKSSTIFCSQYDCNGWFDQLGGDDSPLAEAILDRIKHDAYKINIIPTDPANYRSMREVYGLDPAISE